MLLRMLTALAAALALAVPLPVAAQTPDGEDPLRQHQWGLEQVRAPAAWARSSGDGVTIAVIDTGIDYSHPDLAAKIVPGNTFLGCGEDGCGDGSWGNGHYHGTHVAGIAAAVTGNGEGIAGVAPDADLMSVRVLDANGRGSLSDAALAMRWAVDHGADVLNLSLGSAAGTQLMDEGTGGVDVTRAAQYAAARGAVVVASAGNDTFPLCNPPSWHADVVCVAATDQRELTAAYSNFPNKRRPTGVAAPGGSLLETGRIVEPLCYEGVLSTMPAGQGFDLCGQSPEGLYDELSGTSMAAPHVAGVAALLRSLGCTVEQSTSLLTSTARNPLDGSRGTWTPTYGHGIVDAAAATDAAEDECDGGPPPQPPSPPRADCLQSWHQDFAITLPGETAPVPEGWTVDTAANSDGTAAWETEFDWVAFHPTVRSTATGRGAKDDRLVAPELIATERTSVELAHEFLLEPGRDGGVLETSVDGGQTWQPVPAERIYGHGYNGTIDAGASSPIAGRPAFTGPNPHHVWRRILPDAEVDLSYLAKQRVLLRWRLVQDGARTEALPGSKWALHWVGFSNTLVPECYEEYVRGET